MARPTSSLAPWESHDLEPPEAMILGDVTINPEDFEVVAGAGANVNGKTSTFLFYAVGGTSRALRPTAIPELALDARAPSIPNTPYEDFILTFIDGARCVREILNSSGLEPSEVTVTLLTLLDKRQIVVRDEPGAPARTGSQLSVPGAEIPSDRPELDEDTKALELPPRPWADPPKAESPSSPPPRAERPSTQPPKGQRPPIEAPSSKMAPAPRRSPEPATDSLPMIDAEPDRTDSVPPVDASALEAPSSKMGPAPDVEPPSSLLEAPSSKMGPAPEAPSNRLSAADIEAPRETVASSDALDLLEAPSKRRSSPDVPAPSNQLDSVMQPPPLPSRRVLKADPEDALPAVVPQPLGGDEDEVTELSALAVDIPNMPTPERTPPPWARPRDETDEETADDPVSDVFSARTPPPWARPRRPAPPLEKKSRKKKKKKKRSTAQGAKKRRQTRELSDAEIPVVRARKGTASARHSALPGLENEFDRAEPTTMEPAPDLADPAATEPLPSEPPPLPPSRKTKPPARRVSAGAGEPPMRARGSTKPPRRPKPVEAPTPEEPAPIARGPTKAPARPRPDLAEAQGMPLVLGRRQTDEVESAVADAVAEVFSEPQVSKGPEPDLFDDSLELDLPDPDDFDLADALDDDAPPPRPPLHIGMPAPAARKNEAVEIGGMPAPRQPLPRLDSAFFAPVRPSEVSPSPRPEPPPAPPQPEPTSNPFPSRAGRSHAARERRRQEPDKPKRKAPPREVEKKLPPPADGIRMAKASRLFGEALKDKAEGNLISASMNMKLALTFDPTNLLYIEALEDLSRAVPSGTRKKSRARVLYDKATDAEQSGDIDRAVGLLEDAIKEAKEPAFYNRLGVILAMKKFEFVRAQQLIETALELAPGNPTYEHNLHKVLQMAAKLDVEQHGKKGKSRSGLLGFLGRKK